MKSIVEIVKIPVRFSIKYLGLTKYAKKLRMLPYRKIKRFTATMDGVSVQFSTEDQYSRNWFFPRYAGGRIHEKSVTQMLIREVKNARCFVDVGANLGWYTCMAAKHMPYGSVYGFEMDDLNFSLLKKNIAINDCTNVRVYNLAVSDSVGMVNYKRDIECPASTFRTEPNTRDEAEALYVSVKSVTLDQFLKSNSIVPDIIKIDVEGAEMNILMGMRQILRDCKPILFLEVHPRNLHYFNTSISAILSLLFENNYRVFEIEKMRVQESGGQLNSLMKESMIDENTMLYAVATRELGSNAV